MEAINKILPDLIFSGRKAITILLNRLGTSYRYGDIDPSAAWYRLEERLRNWSSRWWIA